MSILAKEILARVQFSLQNDKEPYYVIAIYKLGNALSFWALSMKYIALHASIASLAATVHLR